MVCFGATQAHNLRHAGAPVCVPMQSSIEGHEIRCDGLESDELERVLWTRICPARGLGPKVEVEGRYATLTELGGTGAQEHSPFRRSPSAEAVAAVAMGSSPTGSSPLAGSFAGELERFMSLNVATRSRQRRRCDSFSA